MSFYDACMLWFSVFVGFATRFPVPERDVPTCSLFFKKKWFPRTPSLSSGSKSRRLPTFAPCRAFGFSTAHCCLSFRCAAFDTLDEISGHRLSGLVVVWIFVSRYVICSLRSTKHRLELLCHPSLRPLAETRPNFLEDHNWALRLSPVDPTFRWIFGFHDLLQTI